jgi:hypothetical protein
MIFFVWGTPGFYPNTPAEWKAAGLGSFLQDSQALSYYRKNNFLQ